MPGLTTDIAGRASDSNGAGEGEADEDQAT